MKEILEKKKIIVIVAALVIIASIVCFCCFNSKKVEVSIMSDNNVLEVLKIKKGTILKDIKKPSLEGKKFLYWEIDGKKVDDNYKITKNSKIKAVFKENNTCKITYVIGDTTIIEELVECGKTIEISSAASDAIDTSNFLYWEVGGEKLDSNLIVKEDLILKAIYNNQVYYKVSFDSQGGSNVKAQTVDSGGKAIMPNNPTKKGYDFVGWQLNGSDYDFSKEVIKDIVLKAKWSKSSSKNTTNNTTQNSTVNNTNNKSTNSNTKYWTVEVLNYNKLVEYKVEDGKKVNLPTPVVPKGKVFKYWYDSDTGEEFDVNTKIHKNYNLSAFYTAYEEPVEQSSNITIDSAPTNIYFTNASPYGTQLVPNITLYITYDPVENADAYEVYYSDTENGNYTKLPGYGSTAYDTQMNKTDRYYKIRAVNQDKKIEGPFSRAFFVPGAVTKDITASLTCRRGTPQKETLSITAGSNVRYRVQKFSTSSGQAYLIGEYSGNNTIDTTVNGVCQINQSYQFIITNIYESSYYKIYSTKDILRIVTANYT